MDNTPIGYKAIQEKLQLNTLPHYRESYIATHGRGRVIIDNDHEIHIYPKSYALKNAEDLFANLEFALKYDGINLEIIKAFFEKMNKSNIVSHIKKQPSGIYSRKIWYLYEFLMNDQLDIPDCRKIQYVDLLDSKKYFTNNAIKSVRHYINNNLLGTHQFCPIVRRTDRIEKYIKERLDDKANALLKKYNPHVIARACNYLYTKETMSSYQIEREQPDKNRITRFVNMLQQAHNIEIFTKEKLIELQNMIVDPRFQDTDYRHTQNYVGENVSPYFQKIHYISPKPENVNELMHGLLESSEKMLIAEIHPVIIAASISFGFVFIHPFEDGNGRIHRFLIHYILSKKDFTPKNMIFPVSAIMLQDMMAYDATLESFSKPLQAVLKNYHLSDDGVMAVKQDSKPFYQYIDFTNMTEYLFKCIDEAIHNQIEREIIFLISYDKTKNEMQEIADIPDRQIDLFIKCVLQNNGQLAKQKKDRFFSLLTDDEINKLEASIRENMMHDLSS